MSGPGGESLTIQGADAAPHRQYPALRERMPNALSAFQDSLGEGRAECAFLPCAFLSYCSNIVL